MPRDITQAERERERAKAEALSKHYREIGPAALLAALLCASRKVDEAEARTVSRAA